MEPCNNQYNNCRNFNLYIYSCCRSVCCAGNIEYRDHSSDHSNICSSGSALSEQYCTITAWYINQWYYRNLVTCYYQYINCWYYNLHVYSCCRSVCCANNDEY